MVQEEGQKEIEKTKTLEVRLSRWVGLNVGKGSREGDQRGSRMGLGRAKSLGAMVRV